MYGWPKNSKGNSHRIANAKGPIRNPNNNHLSFFFVIESFVTINEKIKTDVIPTIHNRRNGRNIKLYMEI
jgi:hypothetical protein